MGEQDGMRQFLHYHKRVFAIMALVCAAGVVGLAAGMRSDPSWALGFGLGAAAQLAKFGFIDVAVVRKVAAEKKDAATTQLKAMFFSLFVFGVAVVVVYKLNGNVWAMAAGIFLPRILLIADAWIRPNPFGNECGEGGGQALEKNDG